MKIIDSQHRSFFKYSVYFIMKVLCFHPTNGCFRGQHLRTFPLNTSFTYRDRIYNCSESEIDASVNGSINFFLNALQDDRDHDHNDTDPQGDYHKLMDVSWKVIPIQMIFMYPHYLMHQNSSLVDLNVVNMDVIRTNSYAKPLLKLISP